MDKLQNLVDQTIDTMEILSVSSAEHYRTPTQLQIKKRRFEQ